MRTRAKGRDNVRARVCARACVCRRFFSVSTRRKQTSDEHGTKFRNTAAPQCAAKLMGSNAIYEERWQPPSSLFRVVVQYMQSAVRVCRIFKRKPSYRAALLLPSIFYRSVSSCRLQPHRRRHRRRRLYRRRRRRHSLLYRHRHDLLHFDKTFGALKVLCEYAILQRARRREVARLAMAVQLGCTRARSRTLLQAYLCVVINFQFRLRVVLFEVRITTCTSSGVLPLVKSTALSPFADVHSLMLL